MKKVWRPTNGVIVQLMEDIFEIQKRIVEIKDHFLKKPRQSFVEIVLRANFKKDTYERCFRWCEIDPQHDNVIDYAALDAISAFDIYLKLNEADLQARKTTGFEHGGP